ncbi:MAG: hypothetical protein H6Q36_1055 [Chloroflexi bacterium]|nr:hypothetical protein [Chloroflexota bacterium]
MRWPLSWLFRSAAEPSPAEGEGEGEAAGSPGEDRAGPPAGLPGAVPARPPAGAWSQLPALRPTVTRAELTAPTESFQRGLAVAHEPEPMLGHLGHDVRADGPAGLVSGLAQPMVMPAADASTAARVGGPALPVRHHVQRLAGPGAPGAPAAAADGDEGSAEDPARIVAAELPGSGEPRTLPVVEPEAVAPALAATAVAPESAPPAVRGAAPLVGRLAVTGSASTSGTEGVAPAVGAAGAGRAPAPDVENPPSVGSTPPRPVADGVAPALDRGGPAVQPPRRTLGESRRLGLGAPLPAIPAAALGGTPGSSPEIRIAGAVAPRLEAPAMTPIAAGAPAPAAARAVTAPLPVLRLARVEASAAPQSPTEAPAEPANSGAPPQAPAAGSRPPAPTVGAVPLAIAGTGVRAVRGATAEIGGPAVAAPTVGRRAGRTDELGDTVTLTAGQSGEPPPVPPAVRDDESPASRLARLAGAPGATTAPADAPSAGPPPSSSGPGILAAPAAALRAQPVVARLLGDRPLRPAAELLIPLAAPQEPAAGSDAEPGAITSLDGLAEPAAPGLTATSIRALTAPPEPSVGGLATSSSMPAPQAAAGRRGVARATRSIGLGAPVGSVTAAGSLPVARLASPEPAQVEPGVFTSETPEVQAILAAGSWSAAGPWTATAPWTAAGPVASAPAGVGRPAAAATAYPALQRQAGPGAGEATVATGGGDEAAGTGATTTGPAGNRDQDMDELARKLYGRIRERLSAELLADRERAGLLVDA